MPSFPPSPLATISHNIPFQDEKYLLTQDWLSNYKTSTGRKKEEWHWPGFKFISFERDELLLLNIYGDRSFELRIKVAGYNLGVACNCGHSGDKLCIHAYCALWTLIWHFGNHYFEKLRPHGSMALAFAHQKYFDKEESTSGLDISPRPELKTVYSINTSKLPVHLIAALSFPAPKQSHDLAQTGEAISYLITLPERKKILPAVLPCTGKLNKDRTAIKSFNGFLSGIRSQKQYSLTEEQQRLHADALALWKMIEKSHGHIVPPGPDTVPSPCLENIFRAWKALLPILQQQSFVYGYRFYGLRDLKYKPSKRRIEKIIVSTLVPRISFLLSDKGAFYRLEMQVWINSNLLPTYSAGTSFFIKEKQNLYMLSSLRDAALAEWMHQSGGWITIFKEHYDEFEKQILQPLSQHYHIEKTTPKTTTKKIQS